MLVFRSCSSPKNLAWHAGQSIFYGREQKSCVSCTNNSPEFIFCPTEGMSIQQKNDYPPPPPPPQKKTSTLSLKYGSLPIFSTTVTSAKTPQKTNLTRPEKNKVVP